MGIDATTLEANAALRSIVRCETGEDYTTFLTRLAEASGIATPTRAELARFDRSRKKKTSNAEWTHPHDPDARVTKMKDGRKHLAHKAEHTVDLETGAVVGVTVQGADTGDTASMVETLIAAAEQVESVLPAACPTPRDYPVKSFGKVQGYHSNETMAAVGLRSYISEPDRGRRCWKEQQAARDAVYANRRWIRGERGRRLLRCRGEVLERPFAHVCETGGMRRVHLRGHPNILKRLLVHVAGCNLGLLAEGGFAPRGRSISGIEHCCGGDDRQRPGATGERDVEFLAGKGRGIENDGVIEFEALDEEGRADETAAAHGSAPVTELRVVPLGGVSKREIRMQQALLQDTRHAVEQIGPDNLDVWKRVQGVEKASHTGAGWIGKVRIRSRRNCRVSRFAADLRGLSTGGGRWQIVAD